MNTGLPRRAMTGMYDEQICDVWDIHTKTVVFTGNMGACSAFIGVSVRTVSSSLQRKARIKKQYTIRGTKNTKP